MIRHLWSALAAVALGLLIVALTACSSSEPQPAPAPTAQQAPQTQQAQQAQQAPVEPQTGAEQPGPAEQDAAQQRGAAQTEPQRPAQQVEPQAGQADSPQAQQAQAQAQAQAAAAAQQSAPPATDFREGLRIVSLFGDLTEIIYELGAGHLVVGRDASSIYPPEAELLPNLGFTQALSAEGVLALEPTLVIGNQTAGPSDVLEQIRDAGVEVVIIDSPSTFDAMGLKIRAVGVALGIEERAEAFAAAAEVRLDAVLADVAARNPERAMRGLRYSLSTCVAAVCSWSPAKARRRQRSSKRRAAPMRGLPPAWSGSFRSRPRPSWRPIRRSFWSWIEASRRSAACPACWRFPASR